jgi:Ribbon-helix-helix protein, copG family
MTQRDESDSGQPLSELLSAAVTKKMHERFEALAAARCQTLSDAIRAALYEHLRRAGL